MQIAANTADCVNEKKQLLCTYVLVVKFIYICVYFIIVYKYFSSVNVATVIDLFN